MFCVGSPDPVRKLMPGEPVFMPRWWACRFCDAALPHLRRVRISFKPIHAWNKIAAAPLDVLCCWAGSTVVGFSTPSRDHRRIGCWLIGRCRDPARLSIQQKRPDSPADQVLRGWKRFDGIGDLRLLSGLRLEDAGVSRRRPCRLCANRREAGAFLGVFPKPGDRCMARGGRRLWVDHPCSRQSRPNADQAWRGRADAVPVSLDPIHRRRKFLVEIFLFVSN